MLLRVPHYYQPGGFRPPLHPHAPLKTFSFNPSVFYQSVQENCMVDDTKRLFEHPCTCPRKISSKYPSNTPFTNHTHRTPFHKPNIPPIIYPHQHSFRSPHPYSISTLGCTRPPWRPHGSHCTLRQG